MAETVFLTGASGFIAKHIIVQLLDAGFYVRGSVRSLRRSQEVIDAVSPHVKDAENLQARLSFVALDLAKDDGWEGVMEGCSALLHTASPFPLQQPKNEDEIIRPAVEGTLRALKAAKDAGIERVVLTSSAVAVMYGELPASKSMYDEADWSEDFHPTQNPYGRSKTHAEKAAWAFVEEQAPDMKLTTINPVLVAGPALDANYGTSLQVVERILSGKDPMQPRFGIPIVDVRDVAEMHVKALQTPESAGLRILATEGFMWMRDMAATLKEAYPDRSIKPREAPDFMIKLMSFFDGDIKTIVPQLGQIKRVSNERARTVLGIDFIKAKDSLLASAQSIETFKS
ncbi:MAG: aldehyde reductase [Pseudomonadota bacterium]